MKIRDKFLPYCVPFHDERENAAVLEAIESNWWSRGPKVAEFEKQFAEYIGVKHALALNSCTAALHLAMKGKGLGPGDEVIVTDMTFCSTVNTIVNCGATPVFADCDSETGLIDVDGIEKLITERTRAVVPVHYAGRPCDMDRINDVAKKHGLFVIEDAAHAVYTTYKGRLIGSDGNPTAFSFYATKNIATGEGGMLTTKDDELYEKAAVLSCHGMSRTAWNRYGKGGKWRYDVLEAGFKYNMTDIAAALGLVQLSRIDEMQAKREEYAKIYNERLADVKGVGILPDTALGRNAWHIYGIKIKKGELKIDRDEFIDILTDKYLVGTSVHFIPVHLHPFYREHFGTKPGDCPGAERFFEEIISIPLNPSMTKDDVLYVADAVAEIARDNAK